jgi:hypothetical protein
MTKPTLHADFRETLKNLMKQKSHCSAWLLNHYQTTCTHGMATFEAQQTLNGKMAFFIFKWSFLGTILYLLQRLLCIHQFHTLMYLDLFCVWICYKLLRNKSMIVGGSQHIQSKQSSSSCNPSYLKLYLATLRPNRGLLLAIASKKQTTSNAAFVSTEDHYLQIHHFQKMKRIWMTLLWWKRQNNCFMKNLFVSRQRWHSMKQLLESVYL